ncbi:MAG: hypothetical protein MMC33_008301 [Icmadophila ericetorum]|nr:hypothetical protein [Icmadophila ericetorum]
MEDPIFPNAFHHHHHQHHSPAPASSPAQTEQTQKQKQKQPPTPPSISTSTSPNSDTALLDLDIFPNLPPFPPSTTIPTAPLLTLSLQKLEAEADNNTNTNKNTDESNRFWHCATDLGFFYLDLRGSGLGEGVLRDVEELWPVGEGVFGLGECGLREFDFRGVGSYFGYKGYGQAVIDKLGTTDRNEFYNVSKDDILGLSAPLPAPKILTDHRPLLKSFIASSHSIVTLLLQLLSAHLNLPLTSSNYLPNFHKLLAPSGDQVRFVHAPPQLDASDQRVALGEHTDFGSVTVLFNRVGGLQVRLPEELQVDERVKEAGGWCYVKPLRGHAIINLGDALTKFSRGLLRSNIHRVAPPPGDQVRCARYSLVYFSRPEDRVLLRGIDEGSVIPGPTEEEKHEKVWNAKDWTLKRALGRRLGGNLEEGYAFGDGDGRGGKGGKP